MSSAIDTAGAKTQNSLFGSLRLRLFGLMLFLLVAGLAAVSALSLTSFEEDLVPEMDRKASTVGRSLSADIGRALAYGIPLNALSGMETFLEASLGKHPEIRYLVVAAPSGQAIYGVGDTLSDEHESWLEELSEAFSPDDEETSVPFGAYFNTAVPVLDDKGSVQAWLHIGVDQKFVQKKLEDILFDVLIVLLVALLITFELLLFVLVFNVSGPIEDLQQLMSRVRNGDFRSILGRKSRDEVGRFAAVFNDSVRLINDLHRGMLARADQYRDRVGDQFRLLRNRMHAAFFELDQHFRFPKGDAPNTFRRPSLVDVRTPLFLFLFAEELSRSFFPLYVRDLYAPIPGLSLEVVLGLPISLFMLFVAIGTPFGGALAEKFGARRMFAVGAGLAVVGFVGTGLAYSLYDLLVWRSLTAIGYALVTMSCQGYIVKITSAGNRAQGMAVFVGAIMVAAICGTSIGGVLADRLGYRVTYILSAALAIAAAFLVWRIFRADAEGEAAKENKNTKKKTGLADWGALLANPRFFMLMMGAAIPAKIMLTGFLFYMAPLFLSELGNSQSEIGRVMMVYFIIMVFGNPLAARISDSLDLKAPLVALGGLLQAGGALLILFVPGTLAILGGIVGLGLGHAFATAPSLALVSQVAPRQVESLGATTVLGIYRVLERVGSVLGPVIAAALIASQGYAAALGGLGWLTLGATVLFIAFFTVAGIEPRQKGPKGQEA